MPEKLASWKEIATFLGVTVKTAQRWEKLRGLPVRRVPGGQKGGVFAVRSEVEDWLQSGGATESAEDEPRPVWTLTRRRLLWAGACTGIALAGVAARQLIEPPVVGATVRGNKILGLASSGETLWERSFEYPLEWPSPISDWKHWVRLVRWPGESQPSVVAAVRWDPPGAFPQFRLICYSMSGRRRWEWAPEVGLRDREGKPFEPSWATQDLMVTRGPNGDSVWLAVANPLRWASAMFKIDSSGSRSLRFAHAGSIQRLTTATQLGSGRIFAAGVNNAWGQPFLAEIGEADPPAAGPSDPAGKYIYKDGPQGAVRKYVLLPGSELNRASTVPYFHVGHLMAMADRLLVETIHIPTGRSAFHYEFDQHLRPIVMRPTGTGISLHQQLQTEGKLDHGVDLCAEFGGAQQFRAWDRASGWSVHEVAPGAPQALYSSRSTSRGR